jgi:predicted transposase YdaD
MRHSPALAEQLFRGVLSMKESSTYQAILAEGMAEGIAQGELREARKLLRIFGDSRFGPPDAQTATAIERIPDLAQLEELCQRMGAAGSWQEVLGQPAPGRRGGRQSSR